MPDGIIKRSLTCPVEAALHFEQYFGALIGTWHLAPGCHCIAHQGCTRQQEPGPWYIHMWITVACPMLLVHEAWLSSKTMHKNRQTRTEYDGAFIAQWLCVQAPALQSRVLPMDLTKQCTSDQVSCPAGHMGLRCGCSQYEGLPQKHVGSVGRTPLS